MASIKVLNITGQECDTLKVSDKVFKQEYNEALIHQVVVAYLANQRQGSKSTLTRSEVRGHAKKPWRQKGTGRARQGSSKSAQWKGGGIIFAPKPRDFSQKVNKTMKKAAFKSAISAKLADSEIVVLDEVKLEAPKTKYFQNILNSFKVDGKNVMFVVGNLDETVLRASNNIPNVDVTYADVLNTYDVVANSKLYITKDAIKKLEEAYK